MGTNVGIISREGAGHPSGTVHLYWIPLGAGAHIVRLSGKVFEAISAGVKRRRPRRLYHSALEIVVPGARFVIEMTPIPDDHGERRGVVVEGRWGRRLPDVFGCSGTRSDDGETA